MFKLFLHRVLMNSCFSMFSRAHCAVKNFSSARLLHHEYSFFKHSQVLMNSCFIMFSRAHVHLNILFKQVLKCSWKVFFHHVLKSSLCCQELLFSLNILFSSTISSAHEQLFHHVLKSSLCCQELLFSALTSSRTPEYSLLKYTSQVLNCSSCSQKLIVLSKTI